MQTVTIGSSGLKVSRLCLGTMVFGTQCDEQAAFAVLNRASELGINFIDLADVYPIPVGPSTWGLSEQIIGRWLKGRRNQFVVATKFGNRVGETPNDVGGSRKHIIETCEASLRRLNTDRIDLYYAHHADLDAPIEETLEAVDRLVQDGKIHYFGLSNFDAWQLALALLAVGARQTVRPVALQPRYNLLYRAAERDLLPLAVGVGMAVLPYNPLAAGMLTGKYPRGQTPPPESRFSWGGDIGRVYQGRYWSDLMFDVVEALVELAQSNAMTPARVALAWVLAQDAVTCPIIGASRPDQLDDSVKALDEPLAPEVVGRLNDVSAKFR